MGERQTEDLKVGCSIHPHRNIFCFTIFIYFSSASCGPCYSSSTPTETAHRHIIALKNENQELISQSYIFFRFKGISPRCISFKKRNHRCSVTQTQLRHKARQTENGSAQNILAELQTKDDHKRNYTTSHHARLPRANIFWLAFLQAIITAPHGSMRFLWV